MDLDTILNKAMKSVPGCMAVGLVDMKTGDLIEVKTVDSHPKVILDLVSAATSDLFQGPNVVTIEKLFKQIRGLPQTDDEHYFQEFIATSKNLIHVFLRGQKKQDQVLVIVTKVTSNLGMVLSLARRLLEKYDDLELPDETEITKEIPFLTSSDY